MVETCKSAQTILGKMILLIKDEMCKKWVETLFICQIEAIHKKPGVPDSTCIP